MRSTGIGATVAPDDVVPLVLTIPIPNKFSQPIAADGTGTCWLVVCVRLTSLTSGAKSNPGDGRRSPNGCYGMSAARGSLTFDIRLANDAAVFVILCAKKRTEIRATHSDGTEPLDSELWFHLGCLQCRAEPASQLGNRFLRCLRRCEQSPPNVNLV